MLTNRGTFKVLDGKSWAKYSFKGKICPMAMNPTEGNVHTFPMSRSLTLFWPVFSSLRARGNQHLALSDAFTRIQIALSLTSQAFFIFFNFSPHILPLQLFPPFVILSSRNSSNLTQSHEKQQLRAENCSQKKRKGKKRKERALRIDK